MRCVILSGGSGNDSLMRGLVELYPQIDIKVIVNAYDDGKSTGVCRSITKCLGVSDIRKNHYRMYDIKSDKKDTNILAFYNNRYDLDMDDKVAYVNTLLTDFGLPFLCGYSNRFFESIPKDKSFDFRSFNIANIIYSQMYREHGYEYTNSFFCELLGIDDFVILNSYDNVAIGAKTTNGELKCEAEIVDYCNSQKPILGVTYTGWDCNINRGAIDTIENADLIILSSGTFWSSLYPTLDYGDFYTHINASKAKKMWVMNNEEDKDSFGISSNDFIKVVETLGLNLDDFIIIQNEDACLSLKQANEKYNIIRNHLGNNRGRHCPVKLAREILSKYYSIDKHYDNIFIDFDDTLWSRDSNSIIDDYIVSKNNIELLSKFHNTQIVSGNSYDSIKNLLGTMDITIWADANSIAYRKGRICDIIDDNVFSTSEVAAIKEYIGDIVVNLGAQLSLNNRFYTTCVKVKPIWVKSMRNDLCDRINSFLSVHVPNAIAKCTGRTTIDILKHCNNKSQILNKVMPVGSTLYIGDETVFGNDVEIANRCNHHISVSDVYETNLVLRLLLNE